MGSLTAWACWLAGLVCGVGPIPDAATIQAAYEREAANGSSLHDKGLQVIEAACGDPENGRYLCQVTFLSSADPNERLYFDVVAVVRNQRGWELRSGLCKR